MPHTLRNHAIFFSLCPDIAPNIILTHFPNFLVRITCHYYLDIYEVQQSTRSPSPLKPVASFEVPKITHSLDKPLEVLMNSLITIILMVIIYYRERIQVKIINGKRYTRQDPNMILQVPFPMEL